MPITPTHIATNKRTGEAVKVEYDPDTKTYSESWMVMLADVETAWDIKPLSASDKLEGKVSGA